MVKVKQDLLNSIKEFTLMDDPFMTKVFEDDIERTQLILRIILENDTIKVKKASTQKRLKNLQGRDLQLDILAEKADGTKFNVEVQNESSGAIPQRARYHMSLLDAKSLPKGEYFDKIPENYVIFITKEDVLKGLLPIYHIHRTIDENGHSFADGSHIIYVNAKIHNDTPLGMLMHDFCCKNPDDMHYKKLAEKIRYFKEEKEGLDKMGDVMEKLIAKREKEAIKKTEKEARISFAKEMLANNESIDKIVKYSKLSVKEVRALAAKMSAQGYKLIKTAITAMIEDESGGDFLFVKISAKILPIKQLYSLK